MGPIRASWILTALLLLCVWVAASAMAGEPATGRALDVAAATEAYLGTVPAEDKARSDAYFEGGYWLQLWGFLYGVLLYWLMLRTGLSAKMRSFSQRISRRYPLQVWAYFVLFLVVVTVASLPLSVYEGFFREHQYGLSNQSFGQWAGDRGKGLLLGVFLGGLAMMAIYAAIRRAGRRWWLWAAFVGIAFVTLGATIAPVYIAPMFNEYTPLEDGPMKERVLSLARANGISVTNVYKSDASRQSKRISANVSGMMGTQRITLNDNLLERCSQEEIEAVMAHEIGHYVLNHAYKGILFFGLVLVAGCAFLSWGFERVHARHGERWGIHGVDDPAGLPLLVLLFSVYGFVLTPVTNSFIRAQEQEADLFGLNSARQPDGFATVALKLGEYRKLEPGELEEVVFFDHPSGCVRIETAMRFKAELLGQVEVRHHRSN
jgi:STE24 endopeptidase